MLAAGGCRPAEKRGTNARLVNRKAPPALGPKAQGAEDEERGGEAEGEEEDAHADLKICW